MARLKGITLILICTCIMQHVLQMNAQAKKGKGRQKQPSLSPKPTIPPLNRKKSGSKDPNDNGALFKGRIANRDGTQCRWAASEGSVKEDGVFVLRITCKKGTEKILHCEYTAKPRVCAEYTSNVDIFWKQIGRSLKKQKKLCRDSKALLKAGMCRKAPRDAHFALRMTPTAHQTSARKKKPCPNLTNKQKLAEEYCSSSWSSICTFFFAMVETEDCWKRRGEIFHSWCQTRTSVLFHWTPVHNYIHWRVQSITQYILKSMETRASDSCKPLTQTLKRTIKQNVLVCCSIKTSLYWK